MGVSGIEHDWFHSYLVNRTQYITLSSSAALAQTTVEMGVPQGSLLGVLLFQLLINELPKSLKYCMSILYADDTMILLIGRSLKFLRIKMQEDLKSLLAWLCMNRLKLNVLKTKAMLLNKEGLNSDFYLKINNQKIEVVCNFKFLGVIIDNSLSFYEHFQVLYNKLL